MAIKRELVGRQPNEYNKFFMHVDHDEKILYDSYILEFEYDPTCNYYERGKYGYRNFHVQFSLLMFNC